MTPQIQETLIPRPVRCHLGMAPKQPLSLLQSMTWTMQRRVLQMGLQSFQFVSLGNANLGMQVT